MSNTNHLKENHPELFKLFHLAFPFYMGEIRKMKTLQADDDTIAAKKILLTQFCLSVLEHLNGIYRLLSIKSFSFSYSPFSSNHRIRHRLELYNAIT